ncbi:hypothetical protein ACFWXK_16385 [Streptomyces sp. NPDC059070]|uniref:hypothetical protein n=1 Tax=Streptomyces sp. NPDC059070 TaxID=3346713 RepID=UPI0036B0389E
MIDINLDDLSPRAMIESSSPRIGSIETPDAWNAGFSEVLAEWDGGTGSGVISLEAFLAASGLSLAAGASVS